MAYFILYHFNIKGLEMQSGLYIVGTPIGNLSDMSPRAVETLKNVDLVAAEDTRVFAKLAAHFDIKTKCVSHHEHNELRVIDSLIEKIQSGASVAVVTDAGMPCISDPGFRLVRAARAAGVRVAVVPGISSEWVVNASACHAISPRRIAASMRAASASGMCVR